MFTEILKRSLVYFAVPQVLAAPEAAASVKCQDSARAGARAKNKPRRALGLRLEGIMS